MVKKAQNVPATMKTLYLHYLIKKEPTPPLWGFSACIINLLFHIPKYGDHLPSHYGRKALFSQ